MAYGLDVEELYYTDPQLVDIGILDKYELDIDLAGEKDFEIRTANYDLPINGFFYIPETEYGGVIRGKRTISEDEEATYTGKSWRGILDEHILNVPDKSDFRNIQGPIDEVINELLKECGLDSLFKCEKPFISDDIDTNIPITSITRGTSLYEAIWTSAKAINLNIVIKYTDKVIYLTPILSIDYSEYMVYSSIGALAFDMTEQAGYINHLILTSVSDTNVKRTIHLFSDGEGTILPYSKVMEPVQDSDYILDKSQQILFGVDEVARYEEFTERVIENYKLVEKAPTDWKRTFGNYYHREVLDESEAFEPYEATESISYSVLTTAPKDWSRNYSSYFDRQIGQSGDYEYTAISASSTLDTANRKKITSIPVDWKTDYNQYYYEYESGTGIAYENYSGITKNKYTVLTSKPTNWEEEKGNLYRRITKTPELVVPPSNTGDKKQKYYYLDVAKTEKGTWVKNSDILQGETPWAPNIFYRKEQYTTAPEFNSKNTYIIPNKEVPPSFKANTYFKQTTSWIPPVFVTGNVYQLVLDHYADMIEEGLAILAEQVRNKQQKVTMDDFMVNIGDTVGGRDEYTGETITAEISNINAKISNGLVEVEYIIGG